MHWARWRKHGDPLLGAKASTDGECSVDGCSDKIRCSGLCVRHYKQSLYHKEKAARPPLVKTCAHCSAEFQPERKSTKYCSRTCQIAVTTVQQRKARSVGRTWNCVTCGADISDKRSDAKFCSDPCANRWDYEQNRERIDEYNRRYASENREKVRDANRRYTARNRERIYARQRAWQQANLEHHKEYQRQYAKAWAVRNRERQAVYVHNRNKRLRDNRDSVGVSVRDWRRLLNRYAGHCAYCGMKSKALHMEHVIPLGRGGRHAIGNVVPACPTCNFSKNDRLLIEWRAGVRRRRNKCQSENSASGHPAMPPP